MPCYEVNVNDYSLNSSNPEMVQRALDSLGIKYEFRQNVGRLNFSKDGTWVVIDFNDNNMRTSSLNGDGSSLVNMIKRQTSMEIIKEAAKLQKWGVKNTGNKVKVWR